MASRIIIRFDPSADGTHPIHEIRNLGEDLYRLCQELGYASVDLTEVDMAVDLLSLTVGPNKKLRRTLRQVEAVLERSPGLSRRARVSVESIGPG